MKLTQIHTTPLTPLQKLSLIRSIQDGQLKFHATIYECSSFVQNTQENESTFLIYQADANDFLKEWLNTYVPEDYWEDAHSKCKRFADTHSQLFTNEKCDEEIQKKYLALRLEKFSTHQFVTATESSHRNCMRRCMNALITANYPIAKECLYLLYQYYMDSQTCTIL